MNATHNGLALNVLHQIELIRKLAPDFGRNRLTDRALARICVALRIELRAADMETCYTAFTLGMVRFVTIRRGLHEFARRFIIFREVCLVLSGERADAETCDAFASVGLFNYAQVRAGRSGWIALRYAILQKADNTWFKTWMASGSARRAQDAAVAVILQLVQAEPGADPDAGTPSPSRLAYAVGRLARMRGELTRGKAWFRYAVRTARAAGDHEGELLGYLGLARIERQAGRYRAALRMYEAIARRARRYNVHSVEGSAYHSIVAIASDTGDGAMVRTYAARAMVAYGATHESLPALAADLAIFWVNQGQFGDALPVLRSVKSRRRDPCDEVVILGYIARACAGAGDVDGFREAWADTMALADRSVTQEGVCDALEELARGAAIVGDWARSEFAAGAALDLAVERGETRREHAAMELLAAARDGRAESRDLTYVEAVWSADTRLAGDLVRLLTCGTEQAA